MTTNPAPQVPGQGYGGYHQGISLLGGWLPLTIEITTVVLLIAVIGWRTGRWRLLWVPVSAALGVGGALLAHWYMDSQGLSSDPAPFQLWIWTAVAVVAIAVAVLGWRRTHWWRRVLSILTIPIAVLTVGLVLNQWVGYFPTVQAAWSAVTAGPLPNQVSADDLPGLRNTNPTTGKIVPIDTGDAGSDFKHRTEYVYLPPAWFAGPTPPKLPVVLMIAGEFNTPADWMRSGNIDPIINAYTASHNGQAPILAFVDAGGTFNNDSECVDGPRGNAADHLTNDVRPYVISQFGASSAAANWGIIGWSMGGTCAVDLTVMHPDLFSSFVDIAGDAGPTAGTKQQTIDRLYGGNAALWTKFDPASVMAAHGPYTGVTGLFEDTGTATKHFGGKGGKGGGHFHKPAQQVAVPSGFGGHDDTPDTDEKGAAETLQKEGTAVGIASTVNTMPGGHTWQFAATAFSNALPWIASKVGG